MTKLKPGTMLLWHSPLCPHKKHLHLLLDIKDGKMLLLPLSTKSCGSYLKQKAHTPLKLESPPYEAMCKKDGYSMSDKLSWFTLSDYPELKSTHKWMCTKFEWDSILDGLEYDLWELDFKWNSTKLSASKKTYLEWCKASSM